MVNYSKYGNKLIAKDKIPISSKKYILSSFFSKKYKSSAKRVCPIIPEPIIHDRPSAIYMSVYIHYGPICIKRSILFFSDFVSFNGSSYSLSSVKYNDSLFEIYLKNLKIRTDDSNKYNYIKNIIKLIKYNHYFATMSVNI